ncbi:MAG: alpha/beta fold hydrolase [Silicimonas sp.]|nr:alpha/beta fold hydrolase [Silicimonas sp.]
MLNTVTHGTDTAATPLLIAHGLFGSARNWGVVAKRLAEKRQVQAVDMRNHGESPWLDSHGYHDMASDLAGTIDGTMDVLGHSMGGKAAMVLALTAPDKVRKLVVADIAPVQYGHTQMPLIDAMRSLDLSEVGARSDADRQLQDTIPEPGVRAFLLQSLDVKSRRWRLNLETLARDMDRIIGFPDITGAFEGPALFLAGADSDYVRPGHREQIRDLFPNAVFAKLPGAGHWLHADKPREFEAAVDAFLTHEG